MAHNARPGRSTQGVGERNRHCGLETLSVGPLNVNHQKSGHCERVKSEVSVIDKECPRPLWPDLRRVSASEACAHNTQRKTLKSFVFFLLSRAVPALARRLPRPAHHHRLVLHGFRLGHPQLDARVPMLVRDSRPALRDHTAHTFNSLESWDNRCTYLAVKLPPAAKWPHIFSDLSRCSRGCSRGCVGAPCMCARASAARVLRGCSPWVLEWVLR